MTLSELTTGIVASYLAMNHIPAAELPGLIQTVHGALAGLEGNDGQPVLDTPELPTRAQIKRSITPDALVSFIDGNRYKLLKRHLSTHGMTPDDYRKRYGLARDYPMTAPNYSAVRAAAAKASGLGVSTRRKASKAAPKPKR